MQAQYQHLDLLLYKLERQFPGRIEIRRYENGTIDYATDCTNITTERQLNVKCVVLPLTMRREFFKGTSATNEKYIKPFLIWKKRLDFEIKTGCIVIYLNKVYNVKEVITVEDKYYYLDTCSVEGEYSE